MLDYEAKRRPEIAQYIEDLPNMSSDDIDQLIVPLPWYRKALHERKATLETKRIAFELDEKSVYWTTIKIIGDVYAWNGPPMNIRIVNGYESQFDIRPGQLILLTTSGDAWFESIFSKTFDITHIQYLRLIKQNVDRGEYLRMVSEELQETYPHAPLMIDLTNGQSRSPLASVRFSR